MYFMNICSECVRFKWREILEYNSGIGEPTVSTHPRISQNRSSDEGGAVMVIIQTCIPEIVALNPMEHRRF